MTYFHVLFNPDAVWLVRPNGPVSVGPNQDLSKCEYSQCHGGDTVRCSISKCSVGSQPRAGKDVTALAVVPKPSGIQIGRKTWDVASRTKQSEVASDATSDDEYTGPGLEIS